MMKLRMLIGLCFLASLAGCISTQQTHALLTPIGAAGIHSFAPPRQSSDGTPVQAKSLDRMTAKDTRR